LTCVFNEGFGDHKQQSPSGEEGYGDQSYRDHVPITRFISTLQTKNTNDQLIMKRVP